MDAECVFENVAVDPKTGKLDFLDYRHGTNGRALALRNRLPHASDTVDLQRADRLVYITRRDTIVPPVARLDLDQAVAFFMLGESIETSAGDPKKAGQPKHEVGFSPFIVGIEDAEGNRLREILKKNPDIEVYLLNTGSVGKGADATGAPAQGVKIPRSVSARILEFLARPGHDKPGLWRKDPDWGYQVPTQVRGIPDFDKYDPARYYRPETFAKLTEELRRERRAFLTQFTDIDASVIRSINA